MRAHPAVCAPGCCPCQMCATRRSTRAVSTVTGPWTATAEFASAEQLFSLLHSRASAPLFDRRLVNGQFIARVHSHAPICWHTFSKGQHRELRRLPDARPGVERARAELIEHLERAVAARICVSSSSSFQIDELSAVDTSSTLHTDPLPSVVGAVPYEDLAIVVWTLQGDAHINFGAVTDDPHPKATSPTRYINVGARHVYAFVGKKVACQHEVIASLDRRALVARGRMVRLEKGVQHMWEPPSLPPSPPPSPDTDADEGEGDEGSLPPPTPTRVMPPATSATIAAVNAAASFAREQFARSVAWAIWDVSPLSLPQYQAPPPPPRSDMGNTCSYDDIE